ncbi:MAG: cytosine permease [Algibacter sp.]
MDKKTKNTENRTPWHELAIVFGGLEFSIPVLLVGGLLAVNFSLTDTILILIIGLVIIQWIGNAVIGYIGAKTGLGSSEVAALSLGEKQSKTIVTITILIISIGWWAIQTAVASDALCELIGVDTTNKLMYALVTLVIGLFFALPSIKGFGSIKWVDYIAIPAGIILVGAAIYLSLKNIGIDAIMSYEPTSGMSFLSAVNLVIGINVAQWLMIPDYTRLAKPKWKDNILIPLGIVGIGFPLFIVGAIMTVSTGSSDIVETMNSLGFPAWGFIVLWLATWTSQMINSYTGGIALGALFNDSSEKTRKNFTFLFSLVGILLAFLGIMDYFLDFLYLLALLVPAITGVVVTHYFLLKNIKQIKSTWNIKATIAIILGALVGYITQYQYVFGIPAIQALLISVIVFYLLSFKRK